VFWQALLSAILIFGVGLLLGVALEDSRNKDIEEILLNSEVNVLDSQLIGIASKGFNVSCEDVTEGLIEFADDVFLEARKLEKYEDSSQLTDVLEVFHRRYDILRVILWTQAVELKERCGGDFHTVVYIYQFRDPDLDLSSEQLVFSRKLQDLKKEYGNEFILIPLAGDLDLKSVDLIRKRYGVESYPVVILDERYVLRSIEELARFDELLFG